MVLFLLIPALLVNAFTVDDCMVPNCVNCDSTFVCNTCSDGYYLAASSSCSSCTDIHLSCESCTDDSTCTSCDFGYFVNASNTCQACSEVMDNCLVCVDDSTCVMCSDGFGTISGGCEECENPIEGCLQCGDITNGFQNHNFNSVIDGSDWAASDTNAVLTLDLSDSALDGGKYLFINHLGTSTDPVTVSQAISGLVNGDEYQLSFVVRNIFEEDRSAEVVDEIFWNDGSIWTFPTDLTAAFITVTLTVTAGSTNSFQLKSTPQAMGFTDDSQGDYGNFRLNLNQDQCPVSCDMGYFLNASGIGDCVPCDSHFPGCLDCSETTCNICQTNHFPNDGGNCDLCSTHITNCAICQSSTVCSFCEIGYTVLSSGGCGETVNTGAGCIEFNDDGTCKDCHPRYIPSENGCIPSWTGTPPDWTWWQPSSSP